MNQVVLYSNHCVQCKVLEDLLKKHNIKYSVVDDVNTMLNLGLTHMPVLDIDGKFMQFKDAYNYIIRS